MIPCWLAICLTVLFAGPATAGADGPPPVGIIDFYGVRKASVERLREALRIREGDPAPAGAEAEEEIARRLRRVRHVDRAAVGVVCCHESRSILFVGIDEGSAPRPAYRPTPSSEVRLPEEISGAYDRFMEALGAAVLRGDARDDTTQGHSLTSDPECRRIQEQFVTLAGANLEGLRRVLRQARDHEQRAAAAWVIGYALDKRAVVDDLVGAMGDPDSIVRNNAVRALGAIAHFARLHPDLGIRIPYAGLVGMIDSLDWSDRNKAMFVLNEITAGDDPGVRDALRRQSLPALAEMARWKSPHALMAFELLGRVAGMRDEEIFQAWSAGQREEQIAGMLSRIGGTR